LPALGIVFMGVVSKGIKGWAKGHRILRQDGVNLLYYKKRASAVGGLNVF
jgi:hypothetical protein